MRRFLIAFIGILWAASAWAQVDGLPQALPLSGFPAVNQPLWGTFWNPGAVINRFADRIFMGAAVQNNGGTSGLSSFGDWCSGLPVRSFNGGDGVGCDLPYAQVAVLFDHTNLAAEYPTGVPTIGVYSVVDSQFAKSANETPRAIEGIAVNDSSLGTSIWGGYFESHRVGGSANGNTYVLELESRNSANDVGFMSPYSAPSGGSFTIETGCGAGLSSTGQFNCTAPMYISANPMPYDSGIVFLAGSLSPSATGSTYEAIGLPALYQIQWYQSGTTLAGSITATSSGVLTFSTAASYQFPNVPTGTPSTYACFDSTFHLIRSSTAC